MHGCGIKFRHSKLEIFRETKHAIQTGSAPQDGTA
ncbi:hypothetical protein EV147_3586 [Cupriavidus agavae]|uniref:Uncharacterized protein n=1 Tax=Cupriavidus agavae TaxID=1001822 RepID=A0A4Q7RT06_9BURK|nr:hypothetical protein EV147_3586 [Cupriavidus agavae]